MLEGKTPSEVLSETLDGMHKQFTEHLYDHVLDKKLQAHNSGKEVECIEISRAAHEALIRHANRYVYRGGEFTNIAGVAFRVNSEWDDNLFAYRVIMKE